MTASPPRGIAPPPLPGQSGGDRERSARFRYLPGLLMALAIHAALLFFWRGTVFLPLEQVEEVEFGVEIGETSVEVSLVAAPPAEEVIETPEPPELEPLPPPPEPMPEPLPEPSPVIEKVPEMVLPEPEPTPPPTPRELPKPRPPQPSKAEPRPKPAVAAAPRAARAVGDGTSAIPGNDATTATAKAAGASAKPGYLRNPHPAYPEEARKAGQQGVVTLRISVDAGGRPTSVQVTRSSGFPLLDERARSTVADRWAFKPARVGGNPIASQIIVPIRFALGR